MQNGNNDSTDHKISSTFSLAAKSVTELYKEAHQQKQKAYKTGYEQCLKDMVNFVNEQLRSQNQNLNGNFSTPFIPLNELENFTMERMNALNQNQRGDEDEIME